MLSFIIPAHNEEQYLGRTLNRLRASADAVGKPWEIIVVADGCNDCTAQIGRHHGARVIEVELRHIAAVRNVGAKAATGDVFIFVDADTLVPHATLAATLDALRGGAIGGGARALIDAPLSRSARLLGSLFTRCYFALNLALGGYLYATREAYEQVGGFDERYFAAEDLIMTWALRKRGRFVVVREPVTTSGRKIEHRSVCQSLLITLRILIRGPRALRQREGLEIWYDDQQRAPAPRHAWLPKNEVESEVRN